MVETETCRKRNWICSNSPPDAWQTGRMSRRISCGPQYGFFPPLLGLANTQCWASLEGFCWRQPFRALDQVLVKWNGLLRGLGLAGADHLTYHRSRHSELSDFEINILPLQTEQFALSESGAYVQEHQDSFSRR